MQENGVAMSGRPYGLLVSGAVGLLIGLAALAVGVAHADPSNAGSTPTTSTSDELADMVMDVIEHPAPAPTTTVVNAPPH
jgi:hypothetical protein